MDSINTGVQHHILLLLSVPPTVKRTYLPAADGIRALACLLVLFVHNTAIVFPRTDRYLIGCGKIGVWLFFVLSAYLLTQQFIARGFSRRELAGYAMSRFLRIYPAYAAAVIAYSWVGTLGINEKSDLIAALTLQSGVGHLWTIPVEFKFYLVLPLLSFAAVLASRRFGSSGVVLLSLLLIILHQLFFPYFQLPGNSISTAWHLSCFQFGICAAFISKSVSARTSNILGYSVLATILLSTPLARSLIFGIPPAPYLLNKYLWFGFLWVIFIVAIVNLREPTALANILKSGPLRVIGRWSFSIYLCHWYFAIKASERYPENPWAMIASLLLAIGFGALMFYAIERPLLLLKKRIQKEF